MIHQLNRFKSLNVNSTVANINIVAFRSESNMEEHEIKIIKLVAKAENGISEREISEKLKIKCPILRSYIHELRHKRHIKYAGKGSDGHVVELTREGRTLLEKM